MAFGPGRGAGWKWWRESPMLCRECRGGEMKNIALVAGLSVTAFGAQAADFDARVVSGTVQLGGRLVIALESDEKTLPDGARCKLDLPPPYAAYVEVVSDDCRSFTLQGDHAPIRDDAGYAIPSSEVPYTLTAIGPDGAEAGRITDSFPYTNQFSDIRVVIEGVRHPVSPGESFPVHVLGAGAPIDGSLLCRWNTYGPVLFEPTSQNECEGRVTATQPDGRDADMDVEIVNLTDMHAVGYGLAKMLVK